MYKVLVYIMVCLGVREFGVSLKQSHLSSLMYRSLVMYSHTFNGLEILNVKLLQIRIAYYTSIGAYIVT